MSITPGWITTSFSHMFKKLDTPAHSLLTRTSLTRSTDPIFCITAANFAGRLTLSTSPSCELTWPYTIMVRTGSNKLFATDFITAASASSVAWYLRHSWAATPTAIATVSTSTIVDVSTSLASHSTHSYSYSDERLPSVLTCSNPLAHDAQK
jgi:hypothetical protein